MRCPFVGRGDKGRPLHWALGMLGVPVSYCLEFGLSGPEYGFPLAASFGDHPIIAHHHDRDSKRTSIYKYGMHLPLRLRSYYLGHHRPLDKAGPSPSFPRSVLQCTCYEVPTCILLYIHIHIYISLILSTSTPKLARMKYSVGITALLATLAQGAAVMSKRDIPLDVKIQVVNNSEVKASITNSGSSSIKVVKTGSILDSADVEKSVIMAGENKVAFDGIRYQVATAGLPAEAFQIIEAGETIEVSFNVASTHDFAQGGDFDIAALVCTGLHTNRPSFKSTPWG